MRELEEKVSIWVLEVLDPGGNVFFPRKKNTRDGGRQNSKKGGNA